MAHVFVSYAREDQAAAKRIVDALAREGIEAWWDHQIPPGRSWDEIIGARIDAAQAVIVVWSAKSIASDFVKEEAQLAFDAAKFLPVLVDAVEPPMGFRRVHAANLAGWKGEPENPQWRALLGEIRTRFGSAAPSGPAAAPPPRAQQQEQQPQSAAGGLKPPQIVLAVALGLFVITGLGALVYAANNNGASTIAEAPYETEFDGPTVPINNEIPAPAPAESGGAVDQLLGWWTRTSGTVCRESYGFRRSGNQVIWTQNEDEYPRDYAVYGRLVGLDSTWRFEPRGNALTIYDGTDQICTFRRGRTAPAPAAPAAPPPTTSGASAALDNLMGWWTRTSGTSCRESYGFRQSGSQVIWTQNEDEYPRAYTVSGDQVGLDSAWRFEARGSTLTIYNDGQQICTFRRGRTTPTAPAAAPTSGTLQQLLGRWQRTSGADCRENYGFRLEGSQVVWRQNEDEYPRAYAVSGGIVTLSSTWRFEPRGNTLVIYDGAEQICTFRRLS